MNQPVSTNYLLYLAHGSPEFKNEALGSILSYLRLKKQTGTARATILVYTDSAEYFQQVLGEVPSVQYVEMPAAQLRAWRGDINFGHRVKVVLMRHAVEQYGGNVLFLDSDTYFVKDDIPLFNAMQQGQRFLHVQESVLSQSRVPLHQTLYSFLSAHPTPEWAALSPTTIMYNSGAIGVSARDSAILDNALQLTDVLYRKCPSHVVEQFAFSFCLQQAGLVTEAIPYVLHYWHMKDARPVLNAFFAKVAGQPLEEILREFEKVPLLAAAQTKFAWEARPRWQRRLMRALKRGWQWPSHS
ncbi:MAG: hypothetical protein ACRYFZ_00250 [Janthinobacterium lividum]